MKKDDRAGAETEPFRTEKISKILLKILRNSLMIQQLKCWVLELSLENWMNGLH